MLFGYPAAAIQDNWLHDCLCDAVRAVHAAIDAGVAYPMWPNLLPEPHRDKLKARRGLRQRCKDYDAAVRNLEKPERDYILRALAAENAIPGLLSGQSDCARTGDLPQIVREAVKSLFGFAFDLLTPLNLRDQQYAAIYSSVPEHVCPFCGIEHFDAPSAAREALDHYLARDHYPFAAANLRNLVPMGHKCNSSYKLATDILKDKHGASRMAFDPYNHTNVAIDLDQSDPFGGVKENTPAWVIKFVPHSHAAETWDEVLSVKKRYKRDHLDPAYSEWLALFGKWAKREGVQVQSDQALVAALRRYEESWVEGGISDRAFLKAAVFRMLRHNCEAGDDRLIDQLRDLVTF